MSFPQHRLRRLRRTESLRRMIREVTLTADDLVQPLFVCPGSSIRKPIDSMPGQFHFSVDMVIEEAKRVYLSGIPAVLLFGLPESKDALGSGGWDPEAPVQQAVRGIRAALPELTIITDVCLCEYTDHGHCGALHDKTVDNDATLDLLCRVALSHAEAGADLVAPSDMMDGRVGAIRKVLDDAGFSEVGILAYSAKQASAYYGPFREAAESAPQFGDRRGYQMDPANAVEALREVRLDIEEGADIVMVKPGISCLDILYRVKQTFGYPTASYQVSGEYAMIEAAAQRGWIDRKRVILETLTAFKRAGADIIITYHAAEVAGWLQTERG